MVKSKLDSFFKLESTPRSSDEPGLPASPPLSSPDEPTATTSHISCTTVASEPPAQPKISSTSLKLQSFSG